MIRALMIDVDGVLVNGRPSDGRGWAAELEADLGLSTADLQREFFKPCWNEVVVGRADLVESLTPVLEKLAPHLNVRELIAYWFRQDSALDIALLDSLSRCRTNGLRVYLATNQEHLRARHLMREMRLIDHVDGMFYSAAIGCKKPDREFFDLVGRQVGVPSSQILLIDDTPANVAGAREAGWNALCWQASMSLDDEIRAIAANAAASV